MLLRNFRSLILRQWGLIVICILVMGIATLVICTLITPVYLSAATVQIISPTSDVASPNDDLSSRGLVSTEAALAIGYPVLQAVASRYPGLTESALAKEVSALPEANTQLFVIQVQDSNSGRAANLANAIAGTLIQQQATEMQQGNVSEQEQLQQELTRTNNQIDALINQINALPANEQSQGAVLQSQLDALEQHYGQWQSLLAQMQISGALNDHLLYLVQPAQPNYSPLRPNIPFILALGLLAGLGLGILGAWLYAEFTICEHTPDELTPYLNWPVLGTIWRTQAQLHETLVHPQAQAINFDAYQALHTNLGFASLDNPLRTLVITSALASEGKSTVAANLAVSLAKTGKNIVLIDANLRQPALQIPFQMKNDKAGLSNALLALSNQTNVQTASGVPNSDSSGSVGSSITLESFCHPVGLPNLRIMPAGPLPLDPTMLYASGAMHDLIALLSRCGSDLVLFDTPATCDFADASILAAQVDATLVVIDPALPTRRQLRRLKTALRQTSTRVIGCVFNKQPVMLQNLSTSSSPGQETPEQQDRKSSNVS